jgi:hypothetical protein
MFHTYRSMDSYRRYRTRGGMSKRGMDSDIGLGEEWVCGLLGMGGALCHPGNTGHPE